MTGGEAPIEEREGRYERDWALPQYRSSRRCARGRPSSEAVVRLGSNTNICPSITKRLSMRNGVVSDDEPRRSSSGTQGLVQFRLGSTVHEDSRTSRRPAQRRRLRGTTFRAQRTSQQAGGSRYCQCRAQADPQPAMSSVSTFR